MLSRWPVGHLSSSKSSSRPPRRRRQTQPRSPCSRVQARPRGRLWEGRVQASSACFQLRPTQPDRFIVPLPPPPSLKTLLGGWQALFKLDRRGLCPSACLQLHRRRRTLDSTTVADASLSQSTALFLLLLRHQHHHLLNLALRCPLRTGVPTISSAGGVRQGPEPSGSGPNLHSSNTCATHTGRGRRRLTHVLPPRHVLPSRSLASFAL